MSLFSTIAHDGPLPRKAIRPQRVKVIAIALAIGAVSAAVSLAPRSDVTDSPIGATAGQLAHAEFIELNTFALVGLEPASAAVSGNTFLYWNIDALENVNPAVSAERVDTASGNSFLYWNTKSIEYQSPVFGEPAMGPR